jgi:hypothetical protein
VITIFLKKIKKRLDKLSILKYNGPMFKLWRTISPGGSGGLVDFRANSVSDFKNSLNNSDGRMIHIPRTLYPIIPDKSMENQGSIQIQKLLYAFFQEKFRFFSENINHEGPWCRQPVKKDTNEQEEENKKPEDEKVYFIFFTFISAPFKVSRGRKSLSPKSRGQGCSLFPAWPYPSRFNPICLLYLKNVFYDQLKSILIASDDRAVSGPGKIIPKKYTGPRPHGFLFLASKKHEETQRKEGAGDVMLPVSHSNRWMCREEVSTPPHTWIWKHTQRKEVSCKKWESLKQTISRTSINC